MSSVVDAENYYFWRCVRGIPKENSGGLHPQAQTPSMLWTDYLWLDTNNGRYNQ
ncbi:MAG: hypothetical protein LW850_34225 [Planctomycetaceae bacterium]|nr:hypothetical protein [Planctomycetaceae bacterium]